MPRKLLRIVPYVSLLAFWGISGSGCASRSDSVVSPDAKENRTNTEFYPKIATDPKLSREHKHAHIFALSRDCILRVQGSGEFDQEAKEFVEFVLTLDDAPKRLGMKPLLELAVALRPEMKPWAIELARKEATKSPPELRKLWQDLLHALERK